MRKFRYLHLDVFTDKPFEGNQLAVFPQARQLDGAVMQQVAAEMNFSETTFILPPERDGDVRMRIFTPREEMPMAGHPTIGSTFALAYEKVIDPGRAAFTFELPVGPTPVELEWDGAQLTFAWMTQRTPVFGPTLDRPRDVAQSLHLEPDDLAAWPVQEVSCGVPFLIVPLATRKAVDRARSDEVALGRLFQTRQLQPRGIFLFSLEEGPDEATAYSRMFAPTLGIAEDPATGAASGPLGCYVVKHGAVDPDRARHIISLQGASMGRPSRVHISIDGSEREIARVRVGGRAVFVAEGTMQIA